MICIVLKNMQLVNQFKIKKNTNDKLCKDAINVMPYFAISKKKLFWN